MHMGVRGLIVLSETCDDIESTYRVFIAAKAANDDMDIAEFCDEYFRTLQDFSVEFFRSRVEKWVTEENVNLFNPSPLEVVTRRLCNLSIDLIEFHKWKDIAFYLIAKKAEFHILDDERHGNTCLLEVAVTSVAHAFDAQIIGTRFLEMLDASNVDLAEYLTFELQHHLEGLLAPKVGICIQQRPWYQSPDPRTIKLDIHEEKLFSLSWDWWLDPKEMGFIVCHEFRHFGRAEHFLYSDSRDHEGLFHWPFIYPDWAIDLNRQTNWKGMVLPTYLQQRYDHRWQKKKIKEAKIQGTYKKPKMPGTWID
ncbi:hypothetical protein L207DRAFT_177344 [Hyaloscypha variabilis F]|uniref:Uncharacterized protein n=1 Tax=Hyaloscypha variabilis (strain UAMH 11265 / GT02V1 / F) TaxID=1149755 RepID=A0A2J6R2D1_HYAVF|nr:hypothetical protein L207DRAFT_177344 [Hyaloscypha variabilis F]